MLAFDDMANRSGLRSDLYTTTLTLGQRNLLGTYSFTPEQGVTVSDLRLTPLPMASHAGHQGNPALRGGLLLWDDETLAEFDLYFARALAGGGFSSVGMLGLNRPGRREFQPHLHGDRLYFNADGSVVTARWSGADPAQAEAWTDEHVVLRPLTMAPRTGYIAAIGEPTIAHRDGETWLYFVYLLWTGDGINANAGRVKLRPDASAATDWPRYASALTREP